MIWFIGGALAAAVAVGGPERMPADLARAAREWDRTQVQGDGAAASRIIADDYVQVSSSGAIEGKAQFVSEIADPQTHLQPFTVEQPIVRVWPGGAVLGGVVELKGTDHGKSFSGRIRFADVWRRQDGRWRLVYTHVSKP